MNYSASILLINKDARAIKCCYEPGAGGNAEKSYTFKSMDPTIAVGDIVAVPTETRVGFTCVKVTEVDVDVDFDRSEIQYKWIVAKVPLDAYKDLLKAEEEAIDKIRKSEVRHRRGELRQKLMANHDAELKDLAIANYAETPALPAAAAAEAKPEA